MYSLPPVYFAEAGTTIEPPQHNDPLQDIAAALTGSLPRNGAAPMTGPVRAVSGSPTAPGLAFDGFAGFGFSKTANGIGVSVGGVLVAEFGSAGLRSGGTPISAGMDFWGTTAPAGWLFSYGQAVSRTTYAALFAVIGTTYGAGDGSTTFNLPDKRGRASYGKDDMGGTSADRITNQSGGWDGDVLGAAGGAETVTLTTDQMPSHNHGGETGGRSVDINFRTNGILVGTGNPLQFVSWVGDAIPNQTGPDVHAHPISSSGSGQAHNNLPPGIVCNYIIYAGV